MPYLIKEDFFKVITAFDLANLTNGDDAIWQGAELSAIEEVKSYLRNRYDVASEFDIEQHDTAVAYVEGDIVIQNFDGHQGVYRAIVDVPIGTQIQDTDFWVLDDFRNKKLVTSVIIIILYENYTRLNGTEIPNWLQLRYDGGDVRQQGGVIGYLKAIQKGTVEPDIPLREDVADGTTQAGNRIAFGSASDVVNRNTSI